MPGRRSQRSRGKRVSYAAVDSEDYDSNDDADSSERAKNTKKETTPKARAPAAGTKKKKLLASKQKAAKRARDALAEEDSSDAFEVDSADDTY